MESHYTRWNHDDIEKKYKGKRNTWDQLFDSEQYFLGLLKQKFSSTLDIGCAYGGTSEVFETLAYDFQYTGVDIIEDMVQVARKIYPQHHFKSGNYLNMEIPNHDLVFSTGVVQHDPNFEQLILRMLNNTNRFLLFDCKLHDGQDVISDRNIAYCNYESRLFFNLLTLDYIEAVLNAHLQKSASISIYGYLTSVHKSVVLPEDIDSVYSCNVLVDLKGEIGTGIQLPADYYSS